MALRRTLDIRSLDRLRLEKLHPGATTELSWLIKLPIGTDEAAARVSTVSKRVYALALIDP